MVKGKRSIKMSTKMRKGIVEEKEVVEYREDEKMGCSRKVWRRRMDHKRKIKSR